MPKSSKQTGRNKRSFAPMDPAMQREYDRLRGNEVEARSGPTPPPSRDASQSSSKVGVQKHARDASTEGVNIGQAKAGSKSRKKP